MVKMVALDESTTSTGVAYFVNDQLIKTTCLTADVNHAHKNGMSEVRVDIMGEKILNILNECKPDIIVMEHPQGASHSLAVTWAIGEVAGIVKSWTIQNDARYLIFNPSEWRRFCGFEQGRKKRNELKQMAMDYVKEKYNIECNSDVSDAVCIGDAYIKYMMEEKE